MSTPITPAANLPPATYPIPAAGDGVTSANTAQYVQPLADSIAFLQNLTPGATPAGSPLFLWSRVGSAELENASAVWRKRYVDGTFGYSRVEQFALGVERFLMPLLIPAGATIRSMTVFVRGSTHASLPLAMPKLELIKQDLEASLSFGEPPVFTLIESQSDVSPDVTTYAQIHTISKVLGTPELVTSACIYSLRITSENGTNEVLGYHVFAGNVGVSQ